MPFPLPAPEIAIRRARAEDCADVARILATAFAEFRPLYTPEAFRATTPAADEIAARLPHGPIWVAIHESSIVGTVSALPRNDSLHIRSMAVIPAGRNRGVGRRLLQHAEDFAAATACPRMDLSTTPFLVSAIELYRRFGFIQCGTVDLHGTPLLVMEKILTRPIP